MTCKREQFGFFEREAKARHGDKAGDAMFDDLLLKIREYAQQHRLEELARKSKGDPIDIGQLSQSQQSHSQLSQTHESWPHVGSENT